MTNQTRLVTHAVFNRTKILYAIPGRDVDSCMKRLRRIRELRDASLFIFYSHKTGKMVDARFN